MHFIKPPRTRRAFLRHIARGLSATALMPFVPTLEAFAQPMGTPKRFAYWYFGTMPPQPTLREMYPTGAQLTFRKGFAVLNPVSAKLILVRGLSNEATRMSSNVGPHPKGGMTFWTGRRFKEGQPPLIFQNDVRSVSGFGPEADSIDQALSKVLKDRNSFGDIRVGVGNEADKDGDVSRSISVNSGQIAPRHQSPASLYNALFKTLPQSGGMPGAPVNTLLVQRKSALDFARESLRRLKTEVSATDVIRLEQHEAAISDVERNITLQMGAGGSNTQCKLPADVMAFMRASANENETPGIYAQMIALAFACRLTQVGGGFYGKHLNSTKYSWVPNYNGMSFHEASHAAINIAGAYMNSCMEHRARTFKQLIDALEAQKEPDGSSVLDHTIAVMAGDTGGSHTHEDTFCLIATGSPTLKTGKMIQANGGNTNQVLRTVAQFMGFPSLNVGAPSIATGPLPSTIFQTT